MVRLSEKKSLMNFDSPIVFPKFANIGSLLNETKNEE